MEYLIKDLGRHWINKSLVYEVLKNSLPISEQFIKNKRIFNDQDLEIFKFYKMHGLEKTLLKYKSTEQKIENKIVWKPFEENQKQFWTEIPDNLIKPVKDGLETVKKQFEEKENSLKLQIEQKDKIISIKDEQTQKYALLKMEEQKEKEEWIKKYDALNDEKGKRMEKFYSAKTYLIVFAILFMFSAIGFLIKFFQ